jgi:Tfp pilus assembly protein PilW
MRSEVRRLHQDERGITLAELLVAMALSLIIVATASGFLGASQKAQGSVNRIDQNTRVSSNVLNEMSRMFRGATQNPVVNATSAPAFIVATPTLVRFYAFVNLTSSETKPVMVQFEVTGGQLVETQWPATAVAGSDGYWTFGSYPGSPSSKRILAPAVASSTAKPFTYLSVDPAAVPSLDPVGDPTVLDDIRYVAVDLEVGSTTVGAYSNVSTSTVIGLPNVMQETL